MKASLAILFLVCLPCSTNTFSQTQERQFSGYGIRFQIRDDLGSCDPIIGSEIKFGFTVPPLMSRDTPPHYSTQVSMINLSARRQGDEWNISVTVTLPNDGGVREMASGRLKEGEKLKVDKFTDYDLLPSEVSIVKIDSFAAQQPSIVNLTSSIEVEKVQASIVPVPYRIFLKNVASKPVQAMEINVYKGMRAWLVMAWPEGGWGRPLIETGATYRIEMPSGGDYKAVAEGEYRPNQSDTVEVTTVVFADGTFEGKPRLAERMAAKNIGNRVQLDRVLTLIDNALESHEPNTAQAVANFKHAISSLEVVTNQSYWAELRNRFPMFDEKTLNDIDRNVPVGLENIRYLVLYDIAAFERESAGNGNNSFRDWLIKEQEKCKTWRSRL